MEVRSFATTFQIRPGKVYGENQLTVETSNTVRVYHFGLQTLESKSITTVAKTWKESLR